MVYIGLLHGWAVAACPEMILPANFLRETTGAPLVWRGSRTLALGDTLDRAADERVMACASAVDPTSLPHQVAAAHCKHSDL